MRKLIIVKSYNNYNRFVYWNSLSDKYEYPDKFKIDSLKYVEFEATVNKKPVLIDLGFDARNDSELIEVIQNFKNNVEKCGVPVRTAFSGNKTTRFYLI